MNNSEYLNDFEREGERFAHTFEGALTDIPLDLQGIYSVQIEITIRRKAYTPFRCTYTRHIDADDCEVLSYSETSCPVPTDPSGEPLPTESAAPYPQPFHNPEAVGVSDEDLQAFDAVIRDPDVNRQFILSLKKARSSKDVAEAVLRLVKQGVIEEKRANKKCFAERIRRFCSFPKGKSEGNLSNTIRNLLTEKHHEIKQTLQKLNLQPDTACAHPGGVHHS